MDLPACLDSCHLLRSFRVCQRRAAAAPIILPITFRGSPKRNQPKETQSFNRSQPALDVSPISKPFSSMGKTLMKLTQYIFSHLSTTLNPYQKICTQSRPTKCLYGQSHTRCLCCRKHIRMLGRQVPSQVASKYPRSCQGITLPCQ